VLGDLPQRPLNSTAFITPQQARRPVASSVSRSSGTTFVKSIRSLAPKASSPSEPASQRLARTRVRTRPAPSQGAGGGRGAPAEGRGRSPRPCAAGLAGMGALMRSASDAGCREISNHSPPIWTAAWHQGQDQISSHQAVGGTNRCHIASPHTSHSISGSSHAGTAEPQAVGFVPATKHPRQDKTLFEGTDL
jgi:hypothetical protein